jgi:hypothetical protein
MTMQISTSTDIHVRLVNGDLRTEIGRTKTVVSLDPGERFQSNEWYGTSRRFEVTAFTLQHGSSQSATGSGTVIRKDGSLGTGRVATTAFRLADIPAHLLTTVMAANQRCADAATRIVQTTPEEN